MRVITPADGMKSLGPCVGTIGFFDGVHRGHRHLIRQVMDVAAGKGMKSMVITFDRHPREVLHCDFRPPLLSTVGEKMELIAQTGVDYCVVLPFDEAMASLSAYDFMSSVLCRQLGLEVLITGYDNRFGHNRSEGFDDYVAYGRELGLDVRKGTAFVLNGVNVSSSVIRSFLQEGEVEMARRCLGYPYTLSGKVVGGEHVGHSLGFPTANLRLDDNRKLIPASGVYAVTVALPGETSLHHGMMNIGTRPTFDGDSMTIETHIFGFSGDVYGMPMGVSLVSRLRGERRFRSTDELVRQLEKDKAAVEEIFEPDCL